ncbi:dihydrofolate reductase [Bartonella sp. TP]|uniref:dihydrofolate reductase n=1 Tax=Bartonella sp. TP TaxID=3057550 RepID=UPI0025AFF39F|nr:dihydrofolate reductase [Bartonella sp. TP]MDN5249216.1 dihydrofolate reductase [Alphaproteobacteria bacterium]WJW79782.1 dihydrofolate reductase [Bartonella sp. TP]
MKPSFSAILAVTKNGVIGQGGRMPWHMPSDLSRFKQLTSGHPVIMGRKTWQSLPEPLKSRTNIVVSRSLKSVDNSGSSTPVIFCDSLAEAMAVSVVAAAGLKTEEVFIIGGEQIYKQAAPYISKLYVTIILAFLVGDAHIFFGDFPGNWVRKLRKIIRKGAKDSYNSVFAIYERES